MMVGVVRKIKIKSCRKSVEEIAFFLASRLPFHLFFFAIYLSIIVLKKMPRRCERQEIYEWRREGN